jgi:hypothetical protein
MATEALRPLQGRERPAHPELLSIAAGLAAGLEAARPLDVLQRRHELLTLLATGADLGDPFADALTVDPAALPATAGVYLISADDHHYVGLALDLPYRFHNPMYGHLTAANRCRSRPLVDHGEYTIRVLRQIGSAGEQLRLDLATAEIVAYAQLRARGYDVVNAVPSLGRVGESSSAPAVLCRLEDGAYLYCDSYTLSRPLIGRTSLSTVLFGYQRTVAGYTARWATPAEIETLSDHVPASGILEDPLVNTTVTAAPSAVTWVGEGRNAGFAWTDGPLTDHDRAALLRYRRRTYDTDTLPTSRFHGVSWESSSGRWQCRAKRGTGSKDLWQTSRRTFTTDVAAAEFREQKINDEGWQQYNTGRYGSNAAALNARLGHHRYAAWSAGFAPAAPG